MTRPTKPKKPLTWDPETRTMRRAKKPSGPSGKHLHAGVLVRAPDAEREAWEAAAAAAGIPRAAWIRGELNAAAARQLRTRSRSRDPYAEVLRRWPVPKKDRAKKG